MLGRDGRIKFVSFFASLGESMVEILTELLGSSRVCQAEADGLRFARTNDEVVARRGFGSDAVWINRVLGAMDYVVVDSVFHITRAVVMSVETACVGFILGEQQFRFALTCQSAAAVLWFLHLDYISARRT